MKRKVRRVGMLRWTFARTLPIVSLLLVSIGAIQFSLFEASTRERTINHLEVALEKEIAAIKALKIANARNMGELLNSDAVEIQSSNLRSISSMSYATVVQVGGQFVYSSNETFLEYLKNQSSSGEWLVRKDKLSAEESIVVTVAVPKQVAYADLSQVLNILLLGGTLSFVVFILGLSLLVVFARRTAEECSQQMKNVDDVRDITQKIDPFGISEIGKLAQSIESVFCRIQKETVSRTVLETKLDAQEKNARDLRDREERTRAILENVSEGIVTTDEYGKIETFNSAASKIFGFMSDDVAGSNIKMLMPDMFRLDHDGYLRNYNATGDLRACDNDQEVVGQRRNGDLFPLELIISPMRVGNRKMYTHVVRDITERKQSETAKNEFVSIVSHELRTPLTALVGSLALVEQGVLGVIPPKAASLVTIALGNAQRLASLVNDILDIQKIESGKIEYSFEDIDMVDVADMVLRENDAYSKKFGVSFTLQCNLDEAYVKADKHRIVQVFNNLLSNAAKFSPEGSKVHLAIEDYGDRFKFSVVDKGPGIPENMKEKIFERFTQLDASDSRSHEGTGLGLGIANSIVESHGGKILVETKFGEGSVFYFELPKASDSYARAC